MASGYAEAWEAGNAQMLIQVNTDNHIEGSEALTQRVEAEARETLGRFGDQITRVSIHLSDANSGAKAGDDDKRCVAEARLAGLKPISVSHHAATVDEAVDGTLGKLRRSLESTIGKLDSR
jgi:ribosome-associated translation inhibitor RaiA